MKTAHRVVATLALVLGVSTLAPAASADIDPHDDPRVPPKDPRIKETLIGAMGISPAQGDIFTYLTVTTAGGCPGGTNSVTRLFGEGFPNYGEIVTGNSELTDFMGKVEGRLVSPMTITLDEAMRKQPERPKPLNGLYRFTFTCQEPLPTSFDMLYGYYEAYVEFINNTYTAISTVESLPEKPAPAMGKAALELASKPQANYDPDRAVRDAQRAAEDTTALASSSKDEDGGSAALALGIVAVILLATTGSVVLARRRSGATRSGAAR